MFDGVMNASATGGTLTQDGKSTPLTLTKSG
jgi:hypothetical protein